MVCTAQAFARLEERAAALLSTGPLQRAASPPDAQLAVRPALGVALPSAAAPTARRGDSWRQPRRAAAHSDDDDDDGDEAAHPLTREELQVRADTRLRCGTACDLATLLSCDAAPAVTGACGGCAFA
jgi:hypothetical protein